MTALHPSLLQVPELISVVATFGAASGQCLNPDNSKNISMGNLTGCPGPHSVDAGSGNIIQVVQRLTV